MPGGLVIILIIVVWLFVLAPLLLRGQKPISRAGDAFEDTRVLYEGGSGELQPRRRPKVMPSDIRRHEDEHHDNIEVVDDTDVLIEEPEGGRTLNMEGLRRGFFNRAPREEEPEAPEVIEGAVVHELEPAVVADAEPEVVVHLDDWDEELPAYEVDSWTTTPEDLLYETESSHLSLVSEVAEEPEEAEVASEGSEAGDASESAEPAEASEVELTEEEIEFARSRRGRGGYDPEADARSSADRYERRRRTLLILAVLLAVTLAVGLIFGGWVWSAPVVACVLTVAYLFALRHQVRAEQALRARRVAQLRRARLGVRSVRDEELQIPRQLRHPGAVVVELDDESPDFVNLPEMVWNPEHDAGGDLVDISGRRAG